MGQLINAPVWNSALGISHYILSLNSKIELWKGISVDRADRDSPRIRFNLSI